MYRECKPLFPKLHKCRWCKQRLNKKMPIVARELFWGDGVSVDCYFCSEDCARAEYVFEETKSKELDMLNERITEGEK